MVVSELSKRLDAVREDALAAGPIAPPPPPVMAAPTTSYPPPPPPLAGGVAASVSSPSAVASVPPPASEQRIRCPQCAEWILPQAKVCRFCGHHLEQSD
jgi:hypothetical protein